jgi:hypothetical protein
MDDGVELQLADELVDHRMPGVGMHEFRSLQGHPRVRGVQAENRFDLRTLLETAGELSAQIARYAGDEYSSRYG